MKPIVRIDRDAFAQIGRSAEEELQAAVECAALLMKEGYLVVYVKPGAKLDVFK